MSSNVVKIESIQQSASKVKIVLSNAQTYFLSLESAQKHQLVAQIVLTDSQLELIEYESTLYEALYKAKQYIAMRDHASGELKVKLKKKKFSKEIIDITISKCQKLGLIDDERYAYSIAEKFVEKKPCGKNFLLAYLQTKMIEREMASRITNLIFASLDMSKQAQKSIEKKWQMYKQLTLEEARNKSYNYLARRGFSFGDAKDAFEAMYNNEQEDENN